VSELMPCPFCGGTDLTDDFTSGGYRWMHVRCSTCRAMSPGVKIDHADYETTRAEARAVWNRKPRAPHFAVCTYCHAMQIEGRREDVGRPLTAEEAAGGFFATHAECRPLLDELFAGLASKGVFVEVDDDHGHVS